MIKKNNVHCDVPYRISHDPWAHLKRPRCEVAPSPEAFACDHEGGDGDLSVTYAGHNADGMASVGFSDGTSVRVHKSRVLMVVPALGGDAMTDRRGTAMMPQRGAFANGYYVPPHATYDGPALSVGRKAVSWLKALESV